GTATSEHLVAVAVPARRKQGGGVAIAEMLLEQHADLEFAQPVLVTHRVRPGGLERQPVGAVACDIPRRMQNLLGGNRHEDAVGLLPRVLAVEPAHELGAAQVREDQTLAQPQRGAPEHLHLVLLRSEEHTSELQSPCNLVCRLLLEKKKNKTNENLYNINETEP